MYDLKPYLEKIDRVIAQGPYQDTWESLSAYQAPEWYQNAKFGKIGRASGRERVYREV